MLHAEAFFTSGFGCQASCAANCRGLMKPSFRQLPNAPCEAEARDDILGSPPTTAIAGLVPTFTFQVEAIATGRFCLFKIAHMSNRMTEREYGIWRRSGDVNRHGGRVPHARVVA